GVCARNSRAECGRRDPAARRPPGVPPSQLLSRLTGAFLPPPILWLRRLHLKFPWRRGLGATAGAKTLWWRAILGVALLPAPAPHRTRLSAGKADRAEAGGRPKEAPGLL
ncbi:rCG54792, partial [Rattus norvegicus]